jgi:predicted dehydrogenase
VAEQKRIRWGILGPGRIAHTFCKDSKFSQSAELAAVASRNHDSAQSFANLYHIPQAYGSYEQLYRDPTIDAIYIATPHNFHFEQAKAALLAGKHVLVEKPITVNAEQCAELIALAQKQNRFLMEAMWTYFLPAIVQAKRWVTEGRIGKIVHVKADFGYPTPYIPGDRMYEPELAGGCLHDLGIYTLALAQYFMEQQPLSAEYHQQRHHLGVEDDLVIEAKYADASATLACSFREKLPNAAFIMGERGCVVIPEFWRAEECFLLGFGEEHGGFSGDVGEVLACARMTGDVAEFIDKREGSGFEFQVEAASRSILSGEIENAVIPHATSLILQKQMDGIFAKIND